jgi:hypothetical protein
MGFINLAEKTINAKLVYYGVGMGGKTSSLQAVHGFMVARNDVQLVSIKTDGDATLLFDFLPINLGMVEGFKIRVQGYTVPGQPKYRLMRKYVLSCRWSCWSSHSSSRPLSSPCWRRASRRTGSVSRLPSS